MKQQKPSLKYIEKAASKLDKKEDFFDISSVFGKQPALQIVRLVINTRISPILFTWLAMLFGIIASFCLLSRDYTILIIGAFSIQIKNIFDTVDGHLARARNSPSRIGRFLDSIVDFLTNCLIFSAIAGSESYSNHIVNIYILSLAALISSLLQCSYYVFYTSSYLARVRPEIANPIYENITDKDYENHKSIRADILISLYTIFNIFYGWQDYFIGKIDKISIKSFDNCPSGWYLDKGMLTLTSVLGLGVQMFLISLFAILNRLYIYLWFIIVAGNMYWLFLIVYRIRKFKKDIG